MQWFGPSWHAPINRTTPEVATPVGETCQHCGEPIAVGEPGVVMPLVDVGGVTYPPTHLDCFIRLTLGSVGHQLQLCPCFGGTYEDPEDMSQREAARAAADLALRRA